MALIANTLNKRSEGVQRKLIGSGSTSHADTGTASDDVSLFELPAGAVITDTHAVVTTAYDGTTPTFQTEVLNLDGSDLGTPIVLDTDVAGALGRTSVAVTAAATVAPTIVTIKNNATDSTVGAITVYVEYFVEGRSDENTG